MQIDLGNLGVVLKDLGVIVGIPILRSVAGWAEHALKDNKVTKFELKKMFVTIVRVGAIGIVGYLGLNGVGVDVSGIAAGAGAFIFDKVIHSVKKE